MDKTLFQQGDPRYTYACFIEAVIKKDWEEALKWCQITWKETTDEPIEMLKQYFYDHEAYECIYIKRSNTEKERDLNPDTVCDIITMLQVKIKGVIVKRKFRPRLIKETGIRKPDANGTWGVNPISALKLIK